MEVLARAFLQVKETKSLQLKKKMDKDLNVKPDT